MAGLRIKGAVFGVAMALVAGLAVAGGGAAQPADSYIIDNPTPSHDFGASFAAKIKPAEAFPGPYSGVLLPPRWAASVMGNPRPIAQLGRRIVLGRGAPNDLDAFYAWLGLTTVATPAGNEVTVGATAVTSAWGPTLSFSCATCHSQNFFGTLVYGMAAKTPRAYDLLTRAKVWLQGAPIGAARRRHRGGAGAPQPRAGGPAFGRDAEAARPRPGHDGRAGLAQPRASRDRRRGEPFVHLQPFAASGRVRFRARGFQADGLVGREVQGPLPVRRRARPR